jgi:hypothetical protein
LSLRRFQIVRRVTCLGDSETAARMPPIRVLRRGISPRLLVD